MSKTIRLERVQFSKAVDLPCFDGARDSASALLGDGPAHELELDITTRIVTIRASAAMRARRGITSADRDFIIEVPLENVAYVRRMTDRTKDAIDDANEKRKALLGASA